MSGKKQNRSIVSLPMTTVNAGYQDGIQNVFDNCLGEHLKDGTGTTINLPSPYSSELKGISDFGIKISGLSSSSSLSWSEEYDSEIGKKVQLELEKLDGIFQGLEEDASSYDVNEIKEWKYYFPNIYILGHDTPTNSADNSDASTNSEDEILTKLNNQHVFGHRYTMFPRNRSCLANKRRAELANQDILNPIRNYNSLPRKPRSLEIDQYLKISSIKSPDTRKRKQNPQYFLNGQISREITGDVSPEYASLPYITATPIKTQSRKRNERSKVPKALILPPIENSFRSISATPRQASSKSMYVSLNYERNSSKRESKAAKLKSDLMKLFDNIPITNR